MAAAYPSATVGAADWLGFAAAPVFGTMALLSVTLGGGPVEMFCRATHGSFPLSGMAGMYWLMSVFHSTPWLRLIANWRRHGPRSSS